MLVAAAAYRRWLVVPRRLVLDRLQALERRVALDQHAVYAEMVVADERLDVEGEEYFGLIVRVATHDAHLLLGRQRYISSCYTRTHVWLPSLDCWRTAQRLE